MTAATNGRRINWYRSPVERDTLARLNQRSDWKGFLQTAGHLGLLVLTGAAACYAAGRAPWWAVLLILYLHGTFFAFLLNAFHEFCHKSVFKTKLWNSVFLQVISFLSWNNPVQFWASHQEHHKFTLHPPEDQEVVLPIKLTLLAFLKSAVINPWSFYYTLKGTVRLSLGKLEGEWETYLFTGPAVEQRQNLFTFARIELLGQILIVAVSLYFHQWMIPVVVTLAPFYGGGLQWLCNNTQHTGLMDKNPDYRLCTRTIKLNPFVQFLYWHMNYHVEHHMYAAVPCYNLAKLHEQIKADLPYCPNGLVDTWKIIIAILKKQEQDPSYQFVAELPGKLSAA